MTDGNERRPGARKQTGTTATAAVVGLFATWRHLVTALVEMCAAPVRALIVGVRGLFRYWNRSLDSHVDSATPRTLELVDDIAVAPKTVARGLLPTLRRVIGSAAVFLSRFPRALAVAWKSWMGQWTLSLTYHADPAASWSAEGGRRADAAAAVGASFFLSGLMIAGLLATTTRGMLTSGLALIATEILWAAARFAIIIMLVPRTATPRARLLRVFLAGLAPYAFGATTLLRIASLVLSAILTSRGLIGVGVQVRDVRSAICWSFGGQACFVAASWLARGGLVLLVGS
ncbi:MAG: hypothetical protein JXA36_01955 [Coriobacteriia bacterium]|nr:hypothetical protein [Coriobacteriia bacterium]